MTAYNYQRVFLCNIDSEITVTVRTAPTADYNKQTGIVTIQAIKIK